jgi:acetyltransferase-like isoleucine patch superfamily enzyme
MIEADDLIIGKGAFISPQASIRGLSGKAKKIHIGDHVYIGPDVQIICDDFSIGDYSKLQHHVNVHGYKPCRIGHNAWVGQYTIIDSIGGTSIGNNFGIGAHSQLWSHIKYGDTLEGCRFLSEKPLEIGSDVWFVGHCIVSPIQASDKSMALAGSVVTNDMAFNTIYAGAPAKAISEKVGPQFIEKTLDEKYRLLNELLTKFNPASTSIRVVKQREETNDNKNITWFVVADRKYTKRQSEEEIAFMRYLLPDKAKFTPY